jgi:hypothetical protein
MIQEILAKVQGYKNRTAYLKSKSDYYPEVLCHNETEEGLPILFLSTLVRIEREGKWYVVHHVESGIVDGKYLSQEMLLMAKLVRAVHMTQNLYRIAPPMKQSDGSVFNCQDEDTLQIAESERVKSKYYVG